MSNLRDVTPKAAQAEIASYADELLFQPSPLQQAMKAQFWSRANSSPLLDFQNLSLADVQEFLPSDPRIAKYWKVPGFREWFSNQDEVKERLDYLWLVGLDSAEQILRDPTIQASAKVNLIKLLAEIKGHVSKGGKDSSPRFSDEKINSMSEKELKEWLGKRGVTVKAEYKVKPSSPAEEEKF